MYNNPVINKNSPYRNQFGEEQPNVVLQSDDHQV